MSDAPEVLLSVVVPVYLGEPFLAELHERLVASLTPISERFEIILVDDRGPDASWKVIQALAKKDARVRGVQLSRNFGQHNAIAAGLAHVRGEWAVVMDCDLQDRPEEIPRFYEKAQEGFDCVLGRRAVRMDGWRKRAGSWIFYKVFNYLTDMSYDGSVANFSLIRRPIVDQLNAMKEVFRFYGGALSWMGFERAYVDVQHDARKQGESSYTMLKLFRLGANTILAHSTKPLRLCIWFGLWVAALSVVAALVIIARAFLYGTPVTGWPTLIVSIQFSTGLIVSALGVLGLYIERIFMQVKERPVFIVRARTDAP